MDDFYKTRTNESIDQIGKKDIEVCIAQNYGSTNEKLGFFLWVLQFRSLCSSFNARIVLNKYITIPLFKAMG